MANIRRSQASTAGLLKTAGPLIATQYSITIIHLVDALIAGRLGLEELAALGPASMMVLLLVTFGLGVMGAVSTFIGQAYGRERYRDCGHYAWQGIWMGVIFGFFCLTLIPTAPVVFGSFFNSTPEVYGLEVEYFRISIVTVGLEMLVDAIAMFAVATGRPLVPLLSAGIAVVMNALSSVALSFGWFGMTPMGLSGVAWGSIIGIGMQAIFLLFFFLKRLNRKKFGTGRGALSWASIRRMSAIGLPSGFQEAVDLASWGVVILWLAGFFGTVHVAATTVLIRCMQMSFLPADGVGIALSIHVAKAVGAHRYRLARSETAATFRLLSLYSLVTAAVFLLFREEIVGLFTSNAEIISIGARCLLLVAAFQWFDAMTVVHVNALQGVGDTVWPALANLILTVIVLVLGGRAMIYFLPEWGSFGVWLVATVYIVLQGLLFWYRWLEGRWRMNELLEGE